MKENPKLYVIIPVYNVENYVEKCLQSVINQTYKNITIICVNDGSTDNSKNILNKFAQIDSRIIVIDTPNGGLSHARNTALKYIFNNYSNHKNKDELITFIDSDDYIDKTAYQSVKDFYDSDIDLYSYGYENVNEEGKVTERFESNNLNIKGLSSVNAVTINRVISSCVCAKIYRRDIIENNKILFPDGVNYEDLFFTNAYLLFCKNIFFIDKYFYKYLQRSDSIMGKTRQKKKGNVRHYINIIEYFFNFINERNIKQNIIGCDLFFTAIKAAIEHSYDYEEEDFVYQRAQMMLNNTPLLKDCITNNRSYKHQIDLIEARDFKEKNSWYFVIRHKHRLNYDKYYLLFIPICKKIYTDNLIKIKLFNIFSLNIR